MSLVYYPMLFAVGLVFGSFLDVLAFRYDENKFILRRESWNGRSRCSHCGKILAWYELIPLVSFAIQRGRCGACRAKISFRYPMSEILSGLVFVFVPWRLSFYHLPPATHNLLSAFWIFAFLALLLVVLIDFRLRVIPDELNLALAGIGLVFILTPFLASWSFLGSYAPLFVLFKSGLIGRLLGGAAGFLFFGGFVVATRGRGMGFGDAKLAGVLGFLFGWPDIILLVFLSFVTGAAAGLVLVWFGRKKMKSILPFGPFLAISATLVFLFGEEVLRGYFWAVDRIGLALFGQ